MERRRLWELSCPVKDILLWTSLDWREALSIAEASGIDIAIPEGLTRENPHAVACALHHVCHDPNPFAIRLDALLDTLHEDSVARVRDSDPEEIAGWLRLDLADLPIPFPALAWAVVADPRPAMRRIEAWLFWRLQIEGLRALAFGKIEVVEVPA